jgi:hypothetical protein
VPGAFTGPQLQRLREAGDVRLAQAAKGAQDGQVIQFLAGVPELLARYRNAPPGAKALIDAAMDARRLGMRPALPHAFLEAAARGYPTDSDWDQLPGDWLEQALAYIAAPCKGVRGPLTRIRPRPARRAASYGDPSPGPVAGAVYRLADYLDQAGRRSRREQTPPAAFWAAAASSAHPGDLAEFQRKRAELDRRQAALTAQQRQLDAAAGQRLELQTVADGIEAFCQTVRARLAAATFEQRRQLAELLIDRVIVTDDQVEIRYVLPTSPDGPHHPFCQVRKDHLDLEELVVGADHELGGDRCAVRAGPQVGNVALQARQGRAFCSSSRLTLLVLPDSWMNRFRFTGAFSATACSAFFTCSSIPRSVLLARGGEGGLDLGGQAPAEVGVRIAAADRAASAAGSVMARLRGLRHGGRACALPRQELEPRYYPNLCHVAT